MSTEQPPPSFDEIGGNKWFGNAFISFSSSPEAERAEAGEKLAEERYGAATDVDGKNLHLRRESRKEMNKKQKLEKTGIKQQKEKKKSGGGEDGSRKKKRNCQLPERWSQYSIGVGRPMANTRFLAFKCPLGPEFFEPKERANLKRFEIGTVLDQVASLDLQLGLVLDLTATDRYYNPQVWADHRIEYEKHPCYGQNVNTKEYYYSRFAISVKRFLAKNSNNGKLIGVHCTHGLNRTGYLICRFLIQEQGWSVHQAIQGFAEARGYPIERDAYIQTLQEIQCSLGLLE